MRSDGTAGGRIESELAGRAASHAGARGTGINNVAVRVPFRAVVTDQCSCGAWRFRAVPGEGQRCLVVQGRNVTGRESMSNNGVSTRRVETELSARSR